VNADHLPENVAGVGQRTFRSIRFEGEEIEFSEGFTDLHTESYRRILAGEGFGIQEALPSIRLVHNIRTAVPHGLSEASHPLARAIG
jgi:UDP-N-acetyl-2-amino-2-deoxyglucuronate dehydrogenase